MSFHSTLGYSDKRDDEYEMSLDELAQKNQALIKELALYDKEVQKELIESYLTHLKKGTQEYLDEFAAKEAYYAEQSVLEINKIKWAAQKKLEIELNSARVDNFRAQIEFEEQYETEKGLDTIRKITAEEQKARVRLADERAIDDEKRLEAQKNFLADINNGSIESEHYLHAIKLDHQNELQRKANANSEAFFKKQLRQGKQMSEQQIKDMQKMYEEEARWDEIRADAKADANKINSILSGNGISKTELAELKASLTPGTKINEYGETVTDLTQLAATFASFAEIFDQKIDSIASNQKTVDTRLQGTTPSITSLLNRTATSQWQTISSQITGAAGVSPFVKQEDIANQVITMVKQGINSNVAQRAFLQTIKTGIADTFNATNGTLLRLIRLQQADSTAARLGMESSLTAFLNNMYENTEYLQGVSESVKGSLESAMALKSAEEAVGFEYQVQKWLGSLYSVGVSQNTVQSIGTALGQISSGQIEGITGNGTGNLMVMAANQAGLSIADILAKGLDESTTNDLLTALAEYANKLAIDSSDNLVVQQQIAQVFGMSAADLKAITNLYTDSTTITSIRGSSSNYLQSLERLNLMIETLPKRISKGEMMTNAFSNLQYTMAAGVANDPALYSIYKVGKMLKDYTGGISLPAISYFGTGFDLETTVADLMEIGAMGGGILKSIGQMIMTGGGGGITPALLANGFGVNPLLALGATKVKRGTSLGGALSLTQGGKDTSSSGYAGNSDGGDVKKKTTDDANADAEQQVDAAEEENEEATTTDINNTLLETLDLFKSIRDGSAAFHVKVDAYGLTGWN